MEKNRIGSMCWYRERLKGEFTPWVRGYLRAWATDHIEYESGPGPVAVGVVEDRQTMGMKAIPVEWITFANARPN